MSEPQTMKCPNCGRAMTIGKLSAVAAFTGKASVVWIDDEKGWSGRELLESYWNPQGVRAHRCRECGVIIYHEMKKTGQEKKE